MTNLIVANTILQQLGGNKFIAMTGAKSLSGGLNSLSFRIGRNCHSINSVKIELTPKDTYDMTFYRVRKMEVTIAARAWDVYCDQLQNIFTEETGMDTHL